MIRVSFRRLRALFQHSNTAVIYNSPCTLCIDESEADTDAGKMAVGIYDGDAGSIIEVLPDMDPKTIDWFFDRFTPKQRDDVRFFCCDTGPEMVAVQRR